MNRRFLTTILWTLLLLLAPIHYTCAQQVEVRFQGGIQPGALADKMCSQLSALLTEVNKAYEEERTVNFRTLRLSEDVQTTISMLWENSPFCCIDDVVTQPCLRRMNGMYQMRNISLLLTSVGQDGETREDFQQGVATFDQHGNLYTFNLALEQNIYSNILQNSIDVADQRYRELILDFTERFRTAYNEHNIGFMEQIFSEDALIVTGQVIKRETRDGVKLPDEIVYNVKSKHEYLTKLKQTFDSDKKNLIHVTFEDLEVMRHPNVNDPDYARVYGVTLRQKYRSGTYSDDGYVFLLWDFSDESKPKIMVRTWQPHSFKGEKIDIYTVDTFKDKMAKK